MSWVVIALVLFVLMLPIVLDEDYQYQVAGHMLAGWFFHFQAAALPAILGNAESLWMPIACLLLSLLYGHRLLMWLASSKGKFWKARQSVCVCALIILGSAAAIAMSGVAHQLVWLSGSKWIDSNRDSPYLTGRIQLGGLKAILDDHHAANGVYPDSLDELTDQSPAIASKLWFFPESDAPPERISYRKPQGDNPAQAMLWVAFSDGGLLVASLDSSIRMIYRRKGGQPNQEDGDEP